MPKLIYTKFSNDRDEKFNIRTDIYINEDGSMRIVKSPDDEPGISHIRNIDRYYHKLDEIFKASDIDINKCKLTKNSVELEYIHGMTLENSIDSYIASGKTDKARELIVRYVDMIRKAYTEKNGETDQVSQLSDGIALDGLCMASWLDIDMVFSNVIISSDGTWTLIDYEWVIREALPIDFVIYRAVFYFLLGDSNREKAIGCDLYELCGVDRRYLRSFELLEERFQRYTKGDKKSFYDYALENYNENAIDVQRGYEKFEVLNNRLKQDNQRLEAENRRLDAYYRQKEADIYNSTSWKLTKPVRKAKDVLRAVRISAGNDKKSDKKGDINLEGTLFEGNNRFLLEGIPLLERCDKRIAVHIHLYYEDLLPEFVSYLEHIPYRYDLFLSVREDADESRVKSGLGKLHKLRRLVIKKVANRGRDLAPLYVDFADDIKKYDYFLHIHTKKSLYTGTEQRGWRQYSLDSLLGSEELVRKIFYLLECGDSVGLIYPDVAYGISMQALHWLKNEPTSRQLLNKWGIPFETGIFSYPAGSFFWCRTDSVRQVFDEGFSTESFDEEEGQTDGTLAHALERVIVSVCCHNGYRNVIMDVESGLLRTDFSNKSYAGIMDMTEDTLYEKLLGYDVISFDIFDTLITRCVYNPDDVFRLMGDTLKNRYDGADNFWLFRKQAEEKAAIKQKAATNIDDIYGELPEIMGISYEKSCEIKELELALEFKVCVPRWDMLRLFNRLKSVGKTLVMVSDMYLGKAYLEQILSRCGYTGYEKLYVSCDVGLRKDTGDIWKAVFSDYRDKSFIHLGDNLRSDWQTLVDKGYEAEWIINSKDMMKLTGWNTKLALNNESEGSLQNGILCNIGIFNSPFDVSSQGHIAMTNPKKWGFVCFGPLFYEFIRWVDENTDDKAKLLFLAREGYLLQQIYNIVHQDDKSQKKDNCYFLASRRAVTVAGIRTWDDVKEIIALDYHGRLSKLVENRFGIALSSEIMDEDLDYTGDNVHETERVAAKLLPMKDIILERAKKEHDNYIRYVHSVISPEMLRDAVVVDVGYAGTIQYFLAKALDEKISGLYLLSFGDMKPLALGCRAYSMYKPGDRFFNELDRTHLFFEIALSAPYGQLQNFDDDAQPVYKKSDGMSEAVKELQIGILDYCRLRAGLSHYEKIDDNRIYEVVYQELMNGKYMDKDISNMFRLEDDYCSNRTVKFNAKANGWE